MKILKYIFFTCFVSIQVACNQSKTTPRIVKDFTLDWQFQLGEHPEAKGEITDTLSWRKLNVPHDWSVEGTFSEEHPAKPEGGALPTGIGWYRKEFSVPEDWKGKQLKISFDGVYRNSEVWVNNHYLGKRPYGYSSFQYDITEAVSFTEKNIIAVRVDNSAQPNSRWYTGSGIYRNVWLVALNQVHVKHWGTFVTTPKVSKEKATVAITTTIENQDTLAQTIKVVHEIKPKNEDKFIASVESSVLLDSKVSHSFSKEMTILNPKLWSPDHPEMYQIITKVFNKEEELLDVYETPLGVRTIEFTAEKGFILNGNETKIKGVCLHHDLGALGAAINVAAIKRRLVSLKEMGVNAIRTAHNPPSPEFLNLCDSMGFLVQDEIFDVWKKKKVKEDYHTEFEEWNERDLKDWILRDRNHPSVFMWSIGNEIREQFDTTGLQITNDLAKMVKSLDTSRPVTSALTENEPEKNYIYQSGALDVLGFNYKHEAYEDLPNRFKGAKFISSESVSALATRGHYDAVPDSTLFWPPAHNKPFDGNEDYTVSAYDKVAAYWGATHEDTWKTIKKLDFIAGMFVWTGADYLGEPIPYPYPARSSYFGILDLAGFPKDVYYMYQSEWSNKDVLHLLPHWNWTDNNLVEVWCYYNNADEVELFLNEISLGKQSKVNDDLHVSWQVPFEKGNLKAISYKDGKAVKQTEIQTAGNAENIAITFDKQRLKNDRKDMVFLEITVTDAKGTMVPNAENQIHFEVTGGGKIAGVDNGYQANLAPFKSDRCKVYNGKCLLIIESNGTKETVHVKATSTGLKSNEIYIDVE